MSFTDIIAEIRKKHYRPVYFLHGEEPYFIDAITRVIEEEVLSDAEKGFNQTVLYGRDVDHLSVLDIARRYPMMSSHQVVIIKEAQDMKSLPELLTYIEKPMPSTLLVIAYKHKKLDMRTKFGKAVQANTLLFESKPLYENQTPDWIKGYLKDKKLTIQGDAAFLIAENLGTDLSKIANELDKLAINLPDGAQVSLKDVESNIGISKEYNVFELQKALGFRDVLKANKIVFYFAANPKNNPLVVVLSSLYGYFSKIYMMHSLKDSSDKHLSETLQLRSDFFLKEYKAAKNNFNLRQTERVISLLLDYDLRAKGVANDNADDGSLLRELVWKILHV